jgi:hypothetical protein
VEPSEELDVVLAAAVDAAATMLTPRVGEAGEEALRTAVVQSLSARIDSVVQAERGITIAEFQGVGPVDWT